jgi:hypothetical protein
LKRPPSSETVQPRPVSAGFIADLRGAGLRESLLLKFEGEADRIFPLSDGIPKEVLFLVPGIVLGRLYKRVKPQTHEEALLLFYEACAAGSYVVTSEGSVVKQSDGEWLYCDAICTQTIVLANKMEE